MNPRRIIFACALAFALGLSRAEVTYARPIPIAPPTIVGVVSDSAGTPLPHVQVMIPQLGRITSTDQQGRFVFRNLQGGAYELKAVLIGFAPGHADVTVPASGGEVAVTIKLAASPLQLTAIQVTATPTGSDARDVAQSVTALSGVGLARQIGPTIAQTLSSEPGISVRFNGPAATAPVIRGLQGERVLILQDGERTGDLASSAPDHSVSIDPLVAQRVEVVRGPASLLYGNQALGGVVNVISNDVPTEGPQRVNGFFAGQTESVNPGGSAAGGLTVPFGQNLALLLRGGGRRSDELRMGGGGDHLVNSFFRNYYGAGGLGFGGGKVNGAVMYRFYHQDYGLPSGGDERSRIEGQRREIEGHSDFTLDNTFLNSLHVSGTAQWYGHDEIDELSGEINTSFNLKTQTIDLVGHTRAGRTAGAIGASGLFKQYGSTGAEALTPAANSNGAGLFFYQEIPLSAAAAHAPKLQLGGRYDLYQISSQAGDSKFGPPTSLDFNTFSGSLGVTVPLGPVMTVSGSVARAFRAPTVEELFSNAFHGALGTYDIGTPTLNAETNQGAEGIVRAQSGRLNGQLAVFFNSIKNYIRPDITGDTTIDSDQGPTTVPLNHVSQADATLRGAEGRLEFEAMPHFVLGAMGDMVRGKLTATKEPLAYMPPARLGGLARWDDGRVSLGAEYRHAFAQDRVPAAASADDPSGVATTAYDLLNLTAGYALTADGRVHSLTLRVDNALDERYADATSRIKSFAFNPGRNLSLVYRVTF